MSALLDAYQFPVKSWRRHAVCKCPVPCQKRFPCPSPQHVGRRATPWCSGALDDTPDLCDACATSPAPTDEGT